MVKLEIYDPAMCCPTGVCGPSVDPELTRVASSLFILEGKGYSISRYNLGNKPDAFVTNPLVNKLLMDKGAEILPVALLDGKVVKTASYPSNEELAKWFGINISYLETKKASENLL